MNKIAAQLYSKKSFLVPGIYDALTAKLVENKGFEIGWVSGFCVATSLGLPDSNVLTIDAFTSRVKEIRNACNLSLIVDCDEGYGTLESTMYLAEKLNSFGIEAICIEDNRFPKINSFKDSPNRALESADDFCKKIRSIKKRSPDLQVIARTEALIAGFPISEAVSRGRAYSEAGADIILMHSRYQHYHQFETLRNAWKLEKPLAVVPTGALDITFDAFEQLGFNLVIYANQLMRKSIFTMNAVLDEFESPMVELQQQAVSMEYVFNLTESESIP
jgi:phosphoenolpyruvate phosphomutase